MLPVARDVTLAVLFAAFAAPSEVLVATPDDSETTAVRGFADPLRLAVTVQEPEATFSE